ncbi:MAG: hypothetical protein C4308_13475 [Chitinophagaceae bacterium]
MANAAKENFLRQKLIPLIQELSPTTAACWGKMNAQQMVEHLSDFFKVSTGRLSFNLVTSIEHLPKYKEFLLSEKEFRENTKAPMLPDEPFALRHSSFTAAIEELEDELNFFFQHFSTASATTTLHPVFGELNYAEWVQLHHKHVKHHLKQFGIII